MDSREEVWGCVCCRPQLEPRECWLHWGHLPGFSSSTAPQAKLNTSTVSFGLDWAWLGKFIGQGKSLKCNRLGSMSPTGNQEPCWVGTVNTQAVWSRSLALLQEADKSKHDSSAGWGKWAQDQLGTSLPHRPAHFSLHWQWHPLAQTHCEDWLPTTKVRSSHDTCILERLLLA